MPQSLGHAVSRYSVGDIYQLTRNFNAFNPHHCLDAFNDMPRLFRCYCYIQFQTPALQDLASF